MDEAGFADFAAARSAMIRRRATVRAAEGGRREHGPGDDHPDMLPEPSEAHETAPWDCHIVYRDENGMMSGRCITVKSIRDEETDLCVGCYCQMRHAPRSFWASRMMEVVELSTGEVADDAIIYFRHHPLYQALTGDVVGPVGSAADAVGACREELVLLTFLAASDGQIDEAEEDHIVTHVMDRFCDPEVGEDAVRSLVRRLSPDERSFERALERLRFGRHEVAIRALKRTMRRIVDDDGRVDLQEIAFVEQIERRLGCAWSDD